MRNVVTVTLMLCACSPSADVVDVPDLSDATDGSTAQADLAWTDLAGNPDISQPVQPPDLADPGDMALSTCGAVGQPCCTTGPACSYFYSKCGATNHCEACGGDGQQCCFADTTANTCAPSYQCVHTNAPSTVYSCYLQTNCGALNQQCCPTSNGGACGPGRQCFNSSGSTSCN